MAHLTSQWYGAEPQGNYGGKGAADVSLCKSVRDQEGGRDHPKTGWWGRKQALDKVPFFRVWGLPQIIYTENMGFSVWEGEEGGGGGWMINS